jgi:glycosyltransferase involved in cell wall biosynthesis
MKNMLSNTIKKMSQRLRPVSLNNVIPVKVAINMKPVSKPWGGGNQFVVQLAEHLTAKGHKVTHRLESDVTCILLIEPRRLDTVSFGVSEIKKFKQKHPSVKCIHRINECDQRKATNFMDDLLHQANEVADFTVFISHWLRDYFIDRWFDPVRPHCVIQNGADSKIFYPTEINIYKPGDVMRVVTHHWSNNWMKGFKVYQAVDQMIASGELEGFALTVIGRWPEELNWLSTTNYPPVNGAKLAGLLRQHHLYLTASLWEPCGMHHIEGAQCGLPLIYHEDGGGIVEFGERYGIGFRNDVKRALIGACQNYQALRDSVMKSAPSGAEMCSSYEEVII